LGKLELDNLQSLFESRDIRTHAKYGTLCQDFLERAIGTEKILLVGSGTQALELCSLMLQTSGEAMAECEVIMPSYTFVSTANAFVIHGAKPVFVDIRADTQNIDETKIEAAVRPGVTRAIVVVHYAGIPCEMDEIMRIARRHGLLVIEDNAHGIFSTYKGKMLGTIGDLGAFSFHYTKNFICGEGGAVSVNRASLMDAAMVAYEKGTNRFDFLKGRISKYAWVDKGGSFPMSEIAASVLYAQLCMREEIQGGRLHIWQRYHARLEVFERLGKLRRPVVPEGCAGNAHIYYVRVPALSDFTRVAEIAKEMKVGIFTHYEPLHSSTGGRKFARHTGCDQADKCARELYRLPMWVGLTEEDIERVVAVFSESFGAASTVCDEEPSAKKRRA